jgi:hypothetical protein
MRTRHVTAICKGDNCWCDGAEPVQTPPEQWQLLPVHIRRISTSDLISDKKTAYKFVTLECYEYFILFEYTLNTLSANLN